MTLAWLPYSNGRPASPLAGRTFGGYLPMYLIPAALLLVTGTVATASMHRASQTIEVPPAPASEPVPEAGLPRLPLQFSAPVRQWSAEIAQWSDEYGLPTTWVATVMQIESCGNPRVHSPAGAAGLFQVMPFHFLPEEDPLDVSTNARRGLAYLASSYLLAKGDPSATLAGYNGGHGLIGLPESSWPEETRRYVHWGTGIIADIDAGVAPSPTLEAWLNAGGARLCRWAAEALGLPRASSVPASARRLS